MVKDIENKKRKASVPANEVAKVKKAKKVAADVAEPAKKRKAIDDAAPVKVKKSKTPKPSIDEAPKPKPAKKVTTPAKAVESEIPVVAPVKDTKKSKDSAAKEVKAGDATESEIKSISKAKPKKEPKREPKKADDTIYSSEEDEAEEKEDAEAVEQDADALSEDDDQTEAFLKGFESDEEEHVTDVAEPAEVPTLNKKLKKQAKKAAEAAAGDRPGVVYIGRIPHGFYENEMREYFKQFGTIQSLRLARNRKTGASKHIAWIKFESSTVADIVAKTMDNYLLFEHILKVKIIPEEQVPENLFKGANKRFKKVPWNKIAGRKLKQGASETTWDKRIEKEEERRKIKADKMKEIGYEYEAPKIKSTKDVAKKGEKLDITADGEAEKEEPKAIEAPPAVEESPKSKKKGKKAKAAEVPALVEDAPTSVLEAKEITPIVTETVVEEVVEAPEKKVKKKKSKTTVIEKEAAALVVETPATSGGAKKLKKKSKSALA